MIGRRIAGWFREQSETRVLFATARYRVCFVRTFGYEYRAVARKRGAYVAMIGALYETRR